MSVVSIATLLFAGPLAAVSSGVATVAAAAVPFGLAPLLQVVVATAGIAAGSR